MLSSTLQSQQPEKYIKKNNFRALKRKNIKAKVENIMAPYNIVIMAYHYLIYFSVYIQYNILKGYLSKR